MQIPKRWQRSRKAGAKQPNSCRYVGRGTMYGNTTKIGHGITRHQAVECYKMDMKIILSRCPDFYDDLLNYEYVSCFCPLDMPCHCDAIIEHLKTRYER
jgi:hypothetical protein